MGSHDSAVKERHRRASRRGLRGHTRGTVTSLLKPASQVGDGLALVPSLLHSLAGQAPGFIPEGGDVHGMAPAPPEVAAIGGRVASKNCRWAAREDAEGKSSTWMKAQEGTKRS